ncbi:MAG: ABC transporter ATP-binding protein [Burkholderiales bacterium]|nr:ABC transporter ATP-binding protein [Burkholderiales bacterium]
MNHSLNIKQILQQAIYKDKKFFFYIASYAIIIAIINLSMPISIQLLINSIANTALIQPILIIGVILTFLLGFSAVLSVMQKHLLEIYKQNSFVRLSSEMFIKSINTEYDALRKYSASGLSSYYFDIFNIQQSASILVMEGFISFLQIIICFTLSSVYHPYFMIMNIIALIIIWLSWKMFKNRAIGLYIKRSESKYKVFGWLNDVFTSNSYFKSNITKNYALDKSFDLINDYINLRKNCWRISFTQLSILTTLYVALAISLFVIGSILVIKGQLSLGQLIAAEILYNVALFGSSKLSNYFDLYYRLVASADELNHVFILPNENKQIFKRHPIIDNSVEDILTLSNLKYRDYANNFYLFDFSIKKQSSNLIISIDEDQQNVLVGLIGNIILPDSGGIKFCNYHYTDFNAQELRDNLWIIDSQDIFSCTIYEYLTHGYNNVSDTEINNILELVSLKNIIYNLPCALQTNLVGSRFPLHSNHIVLLKIARAILHKPKLLIITDVLNMIHYDIQIKILNYIKQHTKITFVHISYIVSQTHIKYDNTLELDRSFIKDN